MRVLIAGGTGLIGRALTEALVADDHEVVVLSRFPERHRMRLPSSVRLEKWDGRTQGEWVTWVAWADAIVNLAGENIAAGRWTAERKRRIRESRVSAGRVLAEAVASVQQRPSVFVQASAVGYYGPCGDEEVTEETPPGNDFLGQVAQEWEASSAAVEELGVRRVIIRTGIVLSREGGALASMRFPLMLGLAGPLGSGRQWFPWIHIADEVGAIRFLMERPEAHGPYNLTAPHPVRNAEFIRVAARTVGRPAVMRVPRGALRLLFGEMADVLLEGQRAVPRRLLAEGYTFRFPTVERALEDVLRSR